MAASSEIVASFRLTPELWYEASRLILQRQHRWLSWRRTWPVVVLLTTGLLTLDRSHWLPEDLLPVLVLLNLLGMCAGVALLLAPALIRRRFVAAYRRLPEENQQVVWRFSPFAVSAEGGMTRFDGGWEDLREIVVTPEFFLVFRKEKSASVIPARAFADDDAWEDFIFMAKSQGTHVTVVDCPPQYP